VSETEIVLTKINKIEVVDIAGDSTQILWGQALPDRLRRQAGLLPPLQSDSDDHVLVARSDAVIDQPLLAALDRAPNTILLTSDTEKPLAACAPQGMVQEIGDYLLRQEGQPPKGFTVQTPEGMGASFWKALRKKETPYALQVSAAKTDEIEWRMFMGTYKGATDLVTKHVWPVPAFYITRWLARLGVRPNPVTLVGAIATVLAFYWFLQGSFALGLVAAWLMTFLDTVDGKLARTTLTSSKWGDVFDHGIDLVHPPFWYAAWAFGLAEVGHGLPEGWIAPLLVIILGGYVAQRLMEGVAIKWLGLEIHIWRKIDTLFRQITARRNPNLLLLTGLTLAGRPDIGLVAVGAWTGICLVLHALQLAQGLKAKRASPNGLSSWMDRT
jgi:phosphatidylglycerophosphate synthase